LIGNRRVAAVGGGGPQVDARRRSSKEGKIVGSPDRSAQNAEKKKPEGVLSTGNTGPWYHRLRKHMDGREETTISKQKGREKCGENDHPDIQVGQKKGRGRGSWFFSGKERFLKTGRRG